MGRHWRVIKAIAATLATVLVVAGCGDDDDNGDDDGNGQESSNLDLSGAAWLGDDRFLAVHDAKNPDEIDNPRLSLLRLPTSLAGVESTEVEIEWPEPLGKSNDLESADRVPGTNKVLFAESGDDGGDYQRIFEAEFDDDGLELVSTADWPKPVHNVEAIAVGQAGEQLVFLYAERAQGKPNTRIAWATFTLDPLRFGKFRSVSYASPEPKGSQARPVTALTVDSAGAIYAGSASDPDVDDGPFSGFVWRIGELRAAGKQPAVVLNDQPELLATMDGFKVEAVVVSETDDGPVVLVGTDDEFYGATLRPLLPTPD